MWFKTRLVYICIIALVSCKKEGEKVITQTEVKFKKEGVLTIVKKDSTSITLDIEIADTDFDVQTGLMYRSSMQNKQGMLFVFDDTKERFFYMKNTQFPLDIIYIDNKLSIVSFQKNAKPFDERSLPSNAPAKYVLELNAGLVDQWNISTGDQIHYTKD